MRQSRVGGAVPAARVIGIVQPVSLTNVHRLIAVNRRTGERAGPLSAEALINDVSDLGVPVACVGGASGIGMGPAHPAHTHPPSHTALFRRCVPPGR